LQDPFEVDPSDIWSHRNDKRVHFVDTLRIKHLFPAAGVLLLLTTSSLAFKAYYSPDNANVPLRWFSPVAHIKFDSAAPQEVVQAVGIDTMVESMNVWRNLTCAQTLTPFNFTFDTNPVTGKSIGFVEGQDNENLFKWVKSHNEWRHGSGVLAITSLTYDTITGEIVDADLELNDAEFSFSTNPGATQADLMNTVVHEAGHFLGLDHSKLPKATMDASAPLGETQKRDLHPDDVLGYCFLYGPDAPAVPDTSAGGSAGQGGGNGDGCHVARVDGRQKTAPSHQGLLILFCVMVLAALRHTQCARKSR